MTARNALRRLAEAARSNWLAYSPGAVSSLEAWPAGTVDWTDFRPALVAPGSAQQPRGAPTGDQQRRHHVAIGRLDPLRLRPGGRSLHDLLKKYAKKASVENPLLD